MAMPSVACRATVRTAAIVALALLTAPPQPASAEDDLLSLVREEQTVTGAAKRPQPISEHRP